MMDYISRIDPFYFIIMAFVLVYCIYKIIMANINRGSKANNNDDVKIAITDNLPYRIKDNFLTPNEYTFFHALIYTVNQRAYICPKVGLKDFLFINKDTKDYMKYWGHISQKHIDFLICHPKTMQPLCAVELDDPSHETEKVKERDAFVEKVYKDAKLPLVRIKTKENYSSSEIELAIGTYLLSNNNNMPNNPTVLCPKCGIPMIIRTTKNGNNKFYGCKNFPNCRETHEINLLSQVTT